MRHYHLLLKQELLLGLRHSAKNYDKLLYLTPETIAPHHLDLLVVSASWNQEQLRQPAPG